MSLFIRASAPELYTVGLRQVIVNNLTLMDWVYMNYCSLQASEKQNETDQTMHGLETIPQISEGQNYPEGQIYKGYSKTYTHLEYALILTYGQVAREDNLYDFLSQMPTFLSNAMRNTIESSAANVLNTIATTTGPDGVYYLSASHPCIDGVQSNTPSVAGDLNYTSLSAAKVAILSRKSWENIPIITPQKLLLCYPPALDPQVTKLMGTTGEPFSSDNTINYLQGMFQPVMVPWMTDSNMWLIMDQPNIQGFNFFWRVKPSLKQFVDDRNDNTAIRIRGRWSCGITDWARALVYGSPGAS